MNRKKTTRKQPAVRKCQETIQHVYAALNRNLCTFQATKFLIFMHCIRSVYFHLIFNSSFLRCIQKKNHTHRTQ